MNSEFHKELQALGLARGVPVVDLPRAGLALAPVRGIVRVPDNEPAVEPLEFHGVGAVAKWAAAIFIVETREGRPDLPPHAAADLRGRLCAGLARGRLLVVETLPGRGADWWNFFLFKKVACVVFDRVGRHDLEFERTGPRGRVVTGTVPA